MTKEELKKEAEEYYEDETEGTFQICEDCYWFADAVQTAYVDSAEPREKQIQIDAEQILALQKQNGELTDKVKDLEAQIEKMKCCYNCSKWNDGQCAYIPNSSYYSADFVCEDWEMKENE